MLFFIHSFIIILNRKDEWKNANNGLRFPLHAIDGIELLGCIRLGAWVPGCLENTHSLLV